MTILSNEKQTDSPNDTSPNVYPTVAEDLQPLLAGGDEPVLPNDYG